MGMIKKEEWSHIRKIFNKPLEDVTTKEASFIIGVEQRFLNELKKLEIDWVKEHPDLFPMYTRLYKNKLVES